MTDYFIFSNKYNYQQKILANGTRSFDVVFRVVTLDGKIKQKRLSGFSSKKEADRGYLEFVTKYCTLASPDIIVKKKEKSAEVHDYTLDEMFAKYLVSSGSDNKNSTLYSKKEVYDKYIRSSIGSCKLSDLSAERLRRWQDDLLSLTKPDGEHYSYNYILRIRITLGGTLNYAESRFGIPNRFRAVKPPKRRAPKTVMQIWTKEQFETVNACCDDPRYRLLLAVLFYTGRRKGEVLALHDTDFKSDRIVFDKTYSRKTSNAESYSITNTKNEKKATSLICAPLRKYLDEIHPQHPFAFGGKRPVSENALLYAFRKACSAAGVDPIRIHDLRHSFVSRCIHLGANMTVVADLIGDTVEQVMNTYGHLYEADKQDVLAKF